MAGYTKLFSSILASSVWNEPDHVRLVWITLLCMCDKRGIVDASVGGISHQARVSRNNTKLALDALMSPDPDSKNPEHDGRRIEARPSGGYIILNYLNYRDGVIEGPEAESNRERQARYRATHPLRNVRSRYTGDGDGSPNTTGGAEKPTTFHAPPDPLRTFNDASNTPATMTER